MDLHHQLAEAAVHAIAHRLDRVDIGNRAAPDFLAGLRIMIGGPDRFDDQCPEAAVRPGHSHQRMIVPEDRADVRVDPEPLPDELNRDDIAGRMRVSKGRSELMVLPLIALIRRLVAFDIVRSDQDLSVQMVLRGILDRDGPLPLLAASVNVEFIGIGRPFFSFFSSMVNGRTDCSYEKPVITPSDD